MNRDSVPVTPVPIRVVDSNRGALLAIRVIPRASRTLVTGVRGEALVVRVTAPPVAGAANDAVTDALADLLTIPRGRLTITAGARGRNKMVLVEGLTAGEVHSRISQRLAERETEAVGRHR